MKSRQPFKKPRQSIARQIGAVASSDAPERKDSTQVNTLTPVASGQWSNISFLTPIAQSVTPAGRIGRKVTLKSLTCRWNGSSLLTNPGRVMVVYDHAPNGALPVIGDILTGNGINDVNQLNNNDRFIILRDFYTNSAVPNGLAVAAESFHIRFPDGGLQQQWTIAATGTIADINTGALYLLFCPVTGVGVLSAVTRVRYTDN